MKVWKTGWCFVSDEQMKKKMAISPTWQANEATGVDFGAKGLFSLLVLRCVKDVGINNSTSFFLGIIDPVMYQDFCHLPGIPWEGNNPPATEQLLQQL